MLTLFILTVVLVLLFTGWREWLFGPVNSRWVAVFFACWLSGWWIAVPAGPDHAVSGAWLTVLAAALAGLLQCGSLCQSLHVLSLSFLAAALHVFIYQLVLVNPLLAPDHPTRISALLIGSLAACLVRGVVQQTAAVTLGLSLGEGMRIWVAGQTFPYLIGNAAFFDLWWLTVAVCLVVSLVWEGIRKMWSARTRFQ